MNLELLPTLESLASKAADLIATDMREAVADHGNFSIALSGGNTPKPVYEALSRKPYGNALPWKQTMLYFGDERGVPCDSPESNYHMACESLLNHIDIPMASIHRVPTEYAAAEAARLYDMDLRELAKDQNRSVPRFDVILLGLGPDGHTASLFPDTPVLDDDKHLAAAVHLPDTSQGVQHAQNRITVTYPVLNAARRILFLVAGADKAAALKRVEAGDESAPAARVAPEKGTVTWLVVDPEQEGRAAS